MTQNSHDSGRRPTRRHFLAASALPLAVVGREALAADCEAGRDALVGAARAYGKLVPAWTEAARARSLDGRDAEAEARFDALDRAYDQSKRRLLSLMRSAGRPVVVDREAGQLYLDCTPAGSHEDLDGLLPETAIVRVVPLSEAMRLG